MYFFLCGCKVKYKQIKGEKMKYLIIAMLALLVSCSKEPVLEVSGGWDWKTVSTGITELSKTLPKEEREVFAKCALTAMARDDKSIVGMTAAQIVKKYKSEID